jgi:DNA invertase Pin-like site-specific DNA recombinase
MRRAVEYVRMSADHQKYSTENQSDAIRKYAEEYGFELVQSYADAGKSGLRIEGREALQQLIQDVQDGTADFEVILVYDVSRWGRFQDADESAYYEYICCRVNKRVEYCAEQFENDGSPIATIVKRIKRAMAGDYSRELSHKVVIGQRRLIERGYPQRSRATVRPALQTGGPGFGAKADAVDQEQGLTRSRFEQPGGTAVRQPQDSRHHGQDPSGPDSGHRSCDAGVRRSTPRAPPRFRPPPGYRGSRTGWSGNASGGLRHSCPSAAP